MTGSLNPVPPHLGGYYSGQYDPDNFNYLIELKWNTVTLVWELWYQGVFLTTVLDDPNPPISLANYENHTVKCDPVGLTLYYEDPIIIVEAEVLNWGSCGWIFCADNSNGVLDNSWDITINGNVIGNYDGEDFTNICFHVDEAFLELAGTNELVFTRTNCVSDDFFEFKLFDPLGAIRYNDSLSGDMCPDADPVPDDSQVFYFILP